MLKTIPRNKWRLFVWIQAGLLALVLVGFGTIAIAQNSVQSAVEDANSRNQVPGMLLTASPSATSGATSAPSDVPSEPSEGGGAPQMDSRAKKVLDEMAQCMAAMNQISQQMSALSEVANSYYNQLQNFSYTPIDFNLSIEEQNAIRASDESRRQALQAQFDAANAAQFAYEATTPLGSGRGMGCWQGSGPYPQ